MNQCCSDAYDKMLEVTIMMTNADDEQTYYSDGADSNACCGCSS